MLFVLSSVGLLTAALGCQCMKGVCDCDYTPWGTPIVPVNPGAAAGAAGAAGPIYAPALAVPTLVPGGKTAEPIKAMPSTDNKAKPPATPDKE
jgi:hypothetical protein